MCPQMLPAAYTIITLTFISLGEPLPKTYSPTNATESNTQYFIQGCKYCINCGRPIFVERMLQNGAAVSAPLHQKPPFPPATRIPHSDRKGSDEAVCYIFLSAILSFDASAKSLWDSRNCFLWTPRESSCAKQLNHCL